MMQQYTESSLSAPWHGPWPTVTKIILFGVLEEIKQCLQKINKTLNCVNPTLVTVFKKKQKKDDNIPHRRLGISAFSLIKGLSYLRGKYSTCFLILPHDLQIYWVSEKHRRISSSEDAELGNL